jgi:hypothetical protein
MVNGSQWFASALRSTILIVRCEGRMPHKPHRQTPIERIFREVTGHKMPQSVRRILLRKRRAKDKST